MVRREAERLWRIPMEIWLMKVEVKVSGREPSTKPIGTPAILRMLR